MTGNRRVYRRPYFFELFAIANSALLLLLLGRAKWFAISTIPPTIAGVGGLLVGCALLGVLIRIAVASARGSAREYLRIVTSAGWLTDFARLLLFGIVVTYTYAWIKLVVPLMHPRLYDQKLWNADQTLLLGHSPNILFVNLFGQPWFLRVIDWSYARVFFVSMIIAFGFFLSEPSRRIRVGFNTGSTLLWLTGAWVYMLIPSLGPAYRFPDVWLPLANVLRLTQDAQALLMVNYQSVLRLQAGGSGSLRIMFGIAAFPSLHVAFQTFAFLWMRRLWVYGQIVFGIFVLTILIGSVVTGWHYLIDGLAGMALAAVAHGIGFRLWRAGRWLRLRAAQG